MSKHTLSVLVENKAGVLTRVAALFSRRSFNIESLAVGPTENPDGTPKPVRIPDFVALAEALGCVGLRCESKDDVDAVIEKAMAIDDAPVVIDFVVGHDAQVWPMVAAGASNDDILAARDVRPVFGPGQV